MNSTESRVIICVDMDAFFASVEQQTNPRLKGKPIAVIGSGGRTVVTTSSYEARAFGVKTGMNVYEARQACPRIIFVVGNNARYTHTCTELTKLYQRFTPDVEVYSVDEVFMDITHSHHLFGGPESIARQIKKGVLEAFGINCTVGIGPNVLLAKLASDLGKPDGLKRLREDDEELENLEVQELWGIGRKTAQKLNAMGIKTCGQLGRTPASLLRNKFGIYGERLKGMGRGQCTRAVQMDDTQAKSVGHSMTLPRDICERRDIEAYLLKLSEMVGRRARRHGLMGRRATLVVRYADFETFTRRCTLGAHTNDTHVLYNSARRELSKMRLRTKVRLLGISLHSLVTDPGQMYLIQDEQKRRDLLTAMDEVNDRFGDFKLTWASHTTHSRHGGVISPAWRPSGVKNVQIK
jgi:DNA polymerase-4